MEQLFTSRRRCDEHATLVGVRTAAFDQSTMLQPVNNLRDGGLAEMHSFGEFTHSKWLSGRLDEQLEQGRLRAGEAGALNELSRVKIKGANYPPQGE